MPKRKKIHSFTKVLVFMFVLLFAVGYTSFSDNVASTVYAAETVYNIEGTEYDINNATTSAAGSYDEVVYCTVCQTELSRETKVIDKLPSPVTPSVPEETVPEETVPEEVVEVHVHSISNVVHKEEIAPTCTAIGSYSETSYCDCGEIMKKEVFATNALGHKYVTVDKVEATCENKGYLISECSYCGDIVYSDYVDALVHVPGEPVEENNVEITSCKNCGKELSRETVEIEALEDETEKVEAITTEPEKIDTIPTEPYHHVVVAIGVAITISSSVVLIFLKLVKYKKLFR